MQKGVLGLWSQDTKKMLSFSKKDTKMIPSIVQKDWYEIGLSHKNTKDAKFIS